MCDAAIGSRTVRTDFQVAEPAPSKAGERRQWVVFSDSRRRFKIETAALIIYNELDGWLGAIHYSGVSPPIKVYPSFQKRIKSLPN